MGKLKLEDREPIVADYLRRNGVIAERARRAGRSLTKNEQNIIYSGRQIAADKGVDRITLNDLEMQGWWEWDKVMAPLKVVFVFAGWDEFGEEAPPIASYHVCESNSPEFPVNGNVGEDQIREAGFKVPKTQKYGKWVKKGRKWYRGEDRSWSVARIFSGWLSGLKRIVSIVSTITKQPQ